MDTIKEDMEMAKVSKEVMLHREKWKTHIHCGEL